LAGATALLWLLALAFPSRTHVQLTRTADGAVGRVNDAAITLTLTDTVPSGGRLGWTVAGPGESRYYEAADPSAPLPILGQISAWLQTLRPAARWEFTPPSPLANAALRPTADGAIIAEAPGSPGGPGTQVDATLRGGRVPAGLLFDLDAADNGYALLVQPERRTAGWWRVANGLPTTALDTTIYRPDFWAGVADILQELALACTAALLLAVLTLGLAFAVRGLERGGGGLGVGGQAARDDSQRPVPPAPLSVLRKPPAASRKPQSALPAWLMPLLFGLLGVGATLAVGLGPLEGIPHVQDDVAYLWQAKIFALGRAWVPAPPDAEAFGQGFILISDGRWFVKYPPGWPLLLVPGVWAGVPWLINPLCAGLSLALIYATGRRLSGPGTGFWAATLGLLSPFFLFMSGSFMSHPSTLCAVAAALYCFVRLMTEDPPQPAELSRRQRFLALATGFCLSWAFISREATAAGVALPFVIWGLLDGGRAAWTGLRGGAARQQAAARVLLYGLVLLGTVPPLLVLGAVNQELLGDPFRLAQELVGSYDRLGFGPGFGPEAGGHTPALGLYNALSYGRLLALGLFGWPPPLTFAPLLLALAAALGRPWRAARWDLFLLGGFLGLVAIYFAWWSATGIFGPRYWYEALPFLLLLAGRGIDWLGQGVATVLGRRPTPEGGLGRAGWLVPGALIGILILFNLAQVLPGQWRAYTGYNDVSADSLHRVTAARLDRALVFVALQPAYPRRDFGKVFFANDPLLRGAVVYARDLGPDHNRALLAAFPDRSPYYLPLTGPVQPGVGP
jgi:hypothetical protein